MLSARRILISALIWAFVTFAGYLVGVTIFKPYETADFISRAKAVYGQVLSKDADNHASVNYTFEANGSTYQGVGHGGAGNPEFEKLQPGQRVIVVYDSANPGKSVLGYPQEDFYARVTGVWFVTIALSVLCLIATGIVNFAIRRQWNDKNFS